LPPDGRGMVRVEATVGTGVGVVVELGMVAEADAEIDGPVPEEATVAGAVELQLFGKTACAEEQGGSEMLLESRVIAPDWQRRRPVTLAPVFPVIEICAMIVP